MKKSKIVLTGGHAGATAYATIEELKKRGSFEIYFIGAKSAVEGKKSSTLESQTLPRMGVTFYPITTGRIQMRFTRHTLPSLFKIPVGFVQAIQLINKIRPEVILSFGGFVAFPVVVVAKMFGIPVIIHEQTIAYGRANKFSQFFATKIALAREESLKYFDRKKTIVVGNPISLEIQSVKPKINLSSPPAIFITGGSRGSEIINETVEKALPALVSKYKIVHQVGELNLQKHSNSKNYEAVGLIPSSEWYKYIQEADLVVSRAGANIVSELIAAKRPSILIPIPWTFMNEQNKNAEYIKKLGIAEIIPQDKLTPQRLIEEIDGLVKNHSQIIRKIKNISSPDINASQNLVNLLLELL